MVTLLQLPLPLRTFVCRYCQLHTHIRITYYGLDSFPRVTYTVTRTFVCGFAYRWFHTRVPRFAFDLYARLRLFHWTLVNYTAVNVLLLRSFCTFYVVPTFPTAHSYAAFTHGYAPFALPRLLRSLDWIVPLLLLLHVTLCLRFVCLRYYVAFTFRFTLYAFI